MDFMSTTIDSISYRYGPTPAPQYQPIKPAKPQGPPRNFYPPGQLAGQVKKVRKDKKRQVSVIEPDSGTSQSSSQQDEEEQSDIAPTLSRVASDQIIPYVEQHKTRNSYPLSEQPSYKQPANNGFENYTGYMRAQNNNETRFSNVNQFMRAA